MDRTGEFPCLKKKDDSNIQKKSLGSQRFCTVGRVWETNLILILASATFYLYKKYIVNTKTEQASTSQMKLLPKSI